MNLKVLVAALVGGVVAFLLGAVLFGMLLAGYYETHMVHYDGLMRAPEEVDLVLTFLSNFILALLLAYAFHGMGVADMRRGALTGAVLGFLLYLCVDLGFIAMMNYFTSPMVVVVDVLANTI